MRPLKLEATRNYGAEVVLHDRLTEDRDRLVQQIVERTGRPATSNPELPTDILLER